MQRQKRASFKKFFAPAFLAFSLALSACTPAVDSGSNPSSPTDNLNGVQNNNNGVILKHQNANEFLTAPANKKLITEISYKYLANFSSFINLDQITSASQTLNLYGTIKGNFLSFNTAVGSKGSVSSDVPEDSDVVVKGLQSNKTTSTNLEYLAEKLASTSSGSSSSDFSLLEANLTTKQKAVEENLNSIEAKLSTIPDISIKSDITVIKKVMAEVATKTKTLPTIINGLLKDAGQFLSNIVQPVTNTDKSISYKLSNVIGVKLFNFVSQVKTVLATSDFSAANNEKNYKAFKQAYNQSLTIFNQISSDLDSSSAKLLQDLNKVIDYLNSYKILQDYLNNNTGVNQNLLLGFIIASGLQKSSEAQLTNFRIPISNYIQAAEAFVSNPVGLPFFDPTNSAFSGIIYNSGSSQLGIAIKSLSNDIQRFKNNGRTLLFNLNLLGNDPVSVAKFEQILNTSVKDDYQRINKAFLSPQNGVETIMDTIKFNAQEIQKYYQLNFAKYFNLRSNTSIAKVMEDLEKLVTTYNSSQTVASKKVTSFSALKQAWKKVTDFFNQSVAFSEELLGTNQGSMGHGNFVYWNQLLQKLQTQINLGNFDVFNVLEFIKNTEELTISFSEAIQKKTTFTAFTDLMGYSNIFNINNLNGLYLRLLVFQNDLKTKSVSDEGIKKKFQELFVSVDNDSTSLIGQLVKGIPVVRNGVGVETNSIEKTRLSYFIKLDVELKRSLLSFENITLSSLPPNDNYASISQALNSWLKIANS